MKIRVNDKLNNGLRAFGLEVERPPEGDLCTTFFTTHASPFGQEVVLFLRSEDQHQLFEALGDHLFNEEGEMTE